MGRLYLRILAIVSTLLVPHVGHGSADWIGAQQQSDGAIARTEDIATPFQSTAEAVSALRLAGRSDLVAAADAYLFAPGYNGTEILSRRIVAAAAAGQPTAPLVSELLTRQNMDGGFGEALGYDSNGLDTAFALSALAASSNAAGTPAGLAVGYMLQRQSASGAWSGADGAPSIYVTSHALRAIWPFRSRFNLGSQVTAARNWILNQRSASGLWGETHLSALALTAILPTLSDRTAVSASVAALAQLEEADGSFARDVYTTALALQVSSLAEMPFADRVVLAGRVIDGDTATALAGAQIVISGPASTTLVTDVDGRFRFESASPGTYGLAISASTYSPMTATTTLRAGQTADFGDIALLRGVVPTTAVLRGRVTDDVDGSPIAGALVELAGPALSTTTNANGEYQIAGIPVGAATITVMRDGYGTAQGAASFVAGQIYNFSPQLRVIASTYVVLEGTVSDAQSATPLPGVTITATVNGSSTSATTDSAGAYRIENLPPGLLSASAALAGFHEVTGSTNAVAGTRVEFSPALTPVTSPQPPPPPSGEIVGVLIDSVSGMQVAGASVQFVVVGSTTRSTTTDADGRFRLVNVVGSGELRFSRTNYRALTISLSVGGGTILDMGAIELVPTSLNNGGAFRGVVFDALTNAPRSGVTITATFGTTTRTATTSATGQFQITGINPLEGSARLTRTGYETLDIGLSLNLGEILDLGTIYVRPVNTAEVSGDLIVQTLDIAGLVRSDIDFSVGGTLHAGVQNSGTAVLAGSINVKAFADLDRNGRFDAGADTDLGNTFVDIDLAPNDVQQISIALAGVMPFRDAPVSVWVDSENTIIEQSENNNVDSTAGICGSAQRLAVDLGLCMDSSGSISAADFQLQLQGTAAAVENPAVLPHDGSVRLTVMQFDSATRVEVAPTIIDASNAASLAARIRAIRKSGGGTAIHSCVNTATQQLSNALPRAAVRVIDLATDGGSNLQQAQQASANAEAAGIDALNALAVGAGADLNVLNAIVFPRTNGPDAGFVVEIDTFQEYSDAIATKIRREARTADLTLGALRVVDEGASVTLTARAGNGGSRTIPSGVVVSFYSGEPGSGGQLLGQVTLPQLTSGEYADISLPGITSLIGGETIVGLADEGGLVGECNTANNRIATSSGILRGALEVGTDAGIYAPNSPVTLIANITNLGRLAGVFRYQLQVEDASGNIVATFPPRETETIAGAASIARSEQWNTALLLAGAYTVRGTLNLLDGTPVAQASAPLAIRHDSSTSPEAELRVSTDRPTYNTTDTVTIDALARNLTQSTLMPGTQIRLTVAAPDSTIVMDRTFVVGDLLGGNVRQISTPFSVIAGAEGTYALSGSLIDAEGVLRASANATFRVQEDLRSTLVGEVSVASDELLVGQTQICTSTVTNRGTLSLPAQALRRLVVRLADSAVVTQSDFVAALAANGSHVDARSHTTSGFGPGDHACVIQALIGEEWADLAYDTFTLTQPPIQIESTFSTGDRGRVLVLVDGPSGHDASDPFSGSDVPDLSTQRAHIESVLDAAGWSYTIVECAEDFEREFYTEGYELYAILSEAVKLPVALQDRVVQAVHAGKGLLLAGNHDRRNSKLETALGIKSQGKNLDVTRLIVESSDVMEPGEEGIAIDATALEMRLEGATPFARYQVNNPKPNQQTAAATFHDFGDGRSVYVSLDLAMAGAAAGDDSLFARLLTSALGYIHPQTITPHVNGVLPLRITLANEGVATSGRIVLTLPVGVVAVDAGTAMTQTDGTLIWEYALDVGDTIELPVWVRLPGQPGDIDFRALIQTGVAPDYADYEERVLTVRVVALP